MSSLLIPFTARNKTTMYKKAMEFTCINKVKHTATATCSVVYKFLVIKVDYNNNMAHLPAKCLKSVKIDRALERYILLSVSRTVFFLSIDIITSI